jgi:hypothetical protein
MRKHIEVAAMRGMTRKQVRMTNAVVHKHAMCLDCAIKFAVAFVWGQERPEHDPTHAFRSLWQRSAGVLRGNARLQTGTGQS